MTCTPSQSTKQNTGARADGFGDRELGCVAHKSRVSTFTGFAAAADTRDCACVLATRWRELPDTDPPSLDDWKVLSESSDTGGSGLRPKVGR